MTNGFDRATSILPQELAAILTKLPASIRERAQEIRIRAGGPVVVSTPAQEWMVNRSGQGSVTQSADTIMAERQTLEDCFYKACEYSVHSHQHELCQGFVTAKNGCRIGIAGTAVQLNGTITSVRDITSVCIRIAREHHGCAANLTRLITTGHIKSTLICGEPSSGKTSLLRDLAHNLADGESGKRYRVTIVDERCELAAFECGLYDVLRGYPKAEGIRQAVRGLAPDVIIFDELGTSAEVSAILDGLNTGTAAICSAHCTDATSLLFRPQLREALTAGAFERVIFLEGRHNPGHAVRIVETGDLLAENNRTCADNSDRRGCGAVRFCGVEPTGAGVGNRGAVD